MNKFWDLFVHKSVKNDEVLYFKSKVLVGLLLIHIPVTIFNTVFFQGYGDLIIYNNVTGICMSLASIIIMKSTGRFYIASIIFSIVAIFNISVSLWVTGGVHSVDIFWFMILSVSISLFVSKSGGLILSAISMLSITGYYIMELNGVRDFRALRMSHEVTEDYINVMVIFSFSAIIHYFFSGTDKIRTKREKQTEQQAKELQETYSLLAANVQELICVHDPQGSITYASPYAESLLGIDNEHLIGQTFSNVFDNELIEISFEKAVETTTQLKIKGKDNEDLWLEIRLVPVFKDKELSRFISTTRNVTTEVEEGIKLKQVRKQIARDFHDEMGNKLASITLNSNVLKSTIDDLGDDTLNVLEKIEKNSKSLYQNSRDFIWSIDSKSDRLKELFTYLRDFGEDLFYTSDTRFYVDSNAIPDIELPISYSRNIVLLFKEAITNSYKYSKASDICFSFKFQDDEIQIAIKDNGQGFDPNTIKEGNGMGNMRDRANKLKGTLDIISNSGQGTEVRLHLPISV